MAIVKQYHKDTNTTYVYESTSYWDADKGQSRSKRRVIGKIDPATGEVVPTGKRGRKKQDNAFQAQSVTDASAAKDQEALRNQILELELTITALKSRIAELENENRQYMTALEKAASLSENISAVCNFIRTK